MIDSSFDSPTSVNFDNLLELDDVDPHVVLYHQSNAAVTESFVPSWNKQTPDFCIETDAIAPHRHVDSSDRVNDIVCTGSCTSSAVVDSVTLPEADDVDPHVVLYHECHSALTEYIATTAPSSIELMPDSCSEMDTTVVNPDSEAKFGVSTVHGETEESLEYKLEAEGHNMRASSFLSTCGVGLDFFPETEDVDPHVVLYQQCDARVAGGLVISRNQQPNETIEVEPKTPERSCTDRCLRSASQATRLSKSPKQSHNLFILAAAWMRALHLRRAPPPAMLLPHRLWFEPIASVIGPWKDAPSCYAPSTEFGALRRRRPFADLTNLQPFGSSAIVELVRTPSPRGAGKVGTTGEVADFRLLRVLKQQSEILGTTLEMLFEKVDLNGDGELTKSEVIEANALLGISPDDAEKLFDEMDIGKHGVLSRRQFSVTTIC